MLPSAATPPAEPAAAERVGSIQNYPLAAAVLEVPLFVPTQNLLFTVFSREVKT